MARRRIGARRGGFRLTAGTAVALALAIGAGAILMLRGPYEAARRVEAADDDAIAAGGRLGGGFFDTIRDAGERVQLAWNAAGKIKALERENAQLREWKELALALSERQQRYEKLLNIPRDELGQGRDVDDSITARLILDPGGPFKRTLLANAGADHGVKVGYVAINENGLIGRVISVGHRSARVLLLDDYNSRVPVMGESSRARALLIGQAGQKPRLDQGPLRLGSPQLQYVVGAGGFRRGERLVTSGDGGIYPRGLLVGWAAQGNGEWRAELGAARQPIDYIRLIPFFEPGLPPDAPAPEQSLPRPPQALYAGPAASIVPSAVAPPRPRPASVKPPSPRAPAAADEEVSPLPPQ